MAINQFGPLALVVIITGSSYAIAEGFEGTGVVEAIDTSRNLVTVDDTILSVPGNLLWEGRPVIQQLVPGQRVGLSGPDGFPYPVIESIYIHPEADYRPERRGQR